MNQRIAAHALAVAVAAGLSACSKVDEPSTGRGVLVVAIDALRADHLTGYGYDRRTTPLLAKFSEGAVVFRNAWSTGPGIVPAHVSLLTGCDPVVANPPPFEAADGSLLQPLFTWHLPDRVPRVAEEFLAGGWTTGAFVDHPRISGLRGFDVGFRDYIDFGGRRGTGQPLFGFEGVGSRFIQWVRERDGDEDWFAYVHLSDLDRMWKRADEIEPQYKARSALDTVPPVGERGPVFFAVPSSRWDGVQRSIGDYESIYDTALSQLDWNLENLFSLLRRSGHFERTTVLVVGSFGVGFGESGLIIDSGTLSDVDLRVPLIIRPEAGLGIDPRTVDLMVSIADVGPTLLELAGLPERRGMHGVSLIAAMGGAAEPPREYAFATAGVHEGFAVIDPRYCYEHGFPGSRGRALVTSSWFGDDDLHRRDLREVVHDRASDPSPGHLHRGPADATVADRMRAAGEAWYADMDRARRVLHPLPWDVGAVDADELAELRAKGIIGEW